MKSAAETRSVIEALSHQHPEADTELHYRNAFELLAATILSAQATDAGVNKVTPALFAKFPDARALAGAPAEEVEALIHSTGFFRQKAKALTGMSRALVERHGGEVPRTRADLEALPGVGRKTANVVLNTAFGEPTMAVDTHIFRVANRTRIAPGKTPLAVEQGLIKWVPKAFQHDAHHWLILHGRYVCTARKPACPTCLIRDLCEYPDKTRGPDPRPGST